MINGLIDSPLVSILVPVFNGEQYLREALDSILAQTYPNIEILVMDDASTDSTPNILTSYGNKISYYRQPNNQGIYENVNNGIKMLKGDYIAIYHADDIYMPTIVEREVDFFKRYPATGAVFCEAIFIDSNGYKFGKFNVQPELRGGGPFEYKVIFNALLTYKNRFLICPTSMVHRRVYLEVGGYRGKEFFDSSDLEMWLRIARKYPLGIVEEPLIKYRHGHQSASKIYNHLRTGEELHFHIMDIYIQDGGKSIATPEAILAYNAHRAEDKLMRTINHYILNQNKAAQNILDQIQLGNIFRSSYVQRTRLLILYGVMQVLVRLPRISFIADFFFRRWHSKDSSGKGKSK